MQRLKNLFGGQKMASLRGQLQKFPRVGVSKNHKFSEIDLMYINVLESRFFFAF